MAFWDKFRKNNAPDNLPPEYAQYYESASNQQRGKNIVAAVLGILLALVVAALLVAGIKYIVGRNSDNTVPSIADTVNDEPATTVDPAPDPVVDTTPVTPTPTTPTTGEQAPTVLPSTGIDE